MTGADAVISIWERGRHEHPVDRTLTVLAGLASRPRGELARLPIEERDRLIVSWRRRLFGPGLVGWAECPRCGCGVEVSLAVDGFGPCEESFVVDVAGEPILARLPTSLDLAAAAEAGEVIAAAAVLLRRVLAAASDPDALAARPEVEAAVTAELDRRAELSAASAELDCPDCATRWTVEVDAGAFVWREIEVLAGRLLREVDVLARRYGWSEREILGLSADRRRFYLELAS